MSGEKGRSEQLQNSACYFEQIQEVFKNWIENFLIYKENYNSSVPTKKLQ